MLFKMRNEKTDTVNGLFVCNRCLTNECSKANWDECNLFIATSTNWLEKSNVRTLKWECPKLTPPPRCTFVLLESVIQKV